MGPAEQFPSIWKRARANAGDDLFQAIMRAAIVVGAAVGLFLMHAIKGQPITTIIVGYLVYSLVALVVLVVRARPFRFFCRFVFLLADSAGILAAITFAGPYGEVFGSVYIMASIGYGSRFGLRVFGASVLLSLIGYAVSIPLRGFPFASPVPYIGTAVMLLVVPGYVYWLLRQTRIQSSTNRDLLTRLYGQRDAERKRIAQDIHDTLQSSLLAARTYVASLGKLGPDKEDRRADMIERLHETMRRVDDQVHNTVHNMWPASLDRTGLVASLHERILEYGDRYPDIEFSVAIDPTVDELKGQTAAHVYSLVSEALLNMEKHAQPSKVRVSLRVDHGTLAVLITDDGKGFDLVHDGVGRHGLLSMKERAAILAGTFRCTSRPGEGTQLRITFPWPSVEAAASA